MCEYEFIYELINKNSLTGHFLVYPGPRIICFFHEFVFMIFYEFIHEF